MDFRNRFRCPTDDELAHTSWPQRSHGQLQSLLPSQVHADLRQPQFGKQPSTEWNLNRELDFIPENLEAGVDDFFLMRRTTSNGAELLPYDLSASSAYGQPLSSSQLHQQDLHQLGHPQPVRPRQTSNLIAAFADNRSAPLRSYNQFLSGHDPISSSPSVLPMCSMPSMSGGGVDFQSRRIVQPDNALPPQAAKCDRSKVLPTPPPFQRHVQGIEILSTHELPDRFQAVFPYPCFNAIQSKCFQTVFFTNDNLVLSAPTGSGKTVIFELAICRAVCNLTAGQFKVVYQAPTKALCAERIRDWERKFSSLDLKCAELTGDIQTWSLENVQHADVIVTTPEKWDSVTRRWQDHEKLMKMVKIFLIDEVHTLKEERGPTLEAVVSRMNSTGSQVRFVALSATIPNLEDIATWLGKNSDNRHEPAVKERFGEEFRPVRLQKHVCGYNTNGNDFALDKILDKKLPDVIAKYCQGGPIMIFCATRNQTVSTAKLLSRLWVSAVSNQRHWAPPMKPLHVNDKELQCCVNSGVAFHNAGIDPSDRQRVELGFLNGNINVICCTSTLAVGVNLPCHMVIIKNTLSYANTGFKEYADLEIMQMLGRAGRPQFSESAVAVIMTRQEKVSHYEKMVTGQEVLESCLHKNLIDHLNAEISLGTVKNLSTATQWLSGTFLYVRMKKNPAYYRLQGDHDGRNVDERLERFCRVGLKELQDQQLITNDALLKTTDLGEAMARYYVQFDTMKKILSLKERAKVSDILDVLTMASEFQDLRFRPGEKSFYKLINGGMGIKIPISLNLDLPSQKVSLIIQSVLGSADLPNGELHHKHHHQYNTEKSLIFQHAQRLIRCIIDCQIYFKDAVSARNALSLARSIAARVWDDTSGTMSQIESVGIVTVRKLVAADIRSIEDLEFTGPHRLEMILNRNPPFGSKLLDNVRQFPKLRISLARRGNPVVIRGKGVRVNIKADIGFLNDKPPLSYGRRPVYVSFVAESTEGALLHFGRISAKKMGMEQPLFFDVMITSPAETIIVHVMCDEQAGTTRKASLLIEIDRSLLPKRMNVEDKDQARKRIIDFDHERHEAPIAKGDEQPRNQTRLRGGGQDSFSDNELDDDDLVKAAEYDSSFIDMRARQADVTGEAAPRRQDKPQRNETNFCPNGDVKSAMDRSQEPEPRPDGRWDCTHKCRNKQSCNHICCRDGLSHPPKPPKLVRTRAEAGSSTKTTAAEAAWGTQRQRTSVDKISSTAKIVSKERETQASKRSRSLLNRPRVLKAPVCSPISSIAQLNFAEDDSNEEPRAVSKKGYSVSRARHKTTEIEKLNDLHARIQKRTSPVVQTNVANKKAKFLRADHGRAELSFPSSASCKTKFETTSAGHDPDGWMREAEMEDESTSEELRNILSEDTGFAPVTQNHFKAHALSNRFGHTSLEKPMNDGIDLAEEVATIPASRLKVAKYMQYRRDNVRNTATGKKDLPEENISLIAPNDRLKSSDVRASSCFSGDDNVMTEGNVKQSIEKTRPTRPHERMMVCHSIDLTQLSSSVDFSDSPNVGRDRIVAQAGDGHNVISVHSRTDCASHHAAQGLQVLEGEDAAGEKAVGDEDEDWFAREFGSYVDVV